jgi:hypothetical protein
VAYKIEWEDRGNAESSTCGGICELTYAVGLLYIFLICMGLLFIALKQHESLNAFRAHPAESALFQAFLPFDSGR